jgi:hypothetical protein
MSPAINSTKMPKSQSEHLLRVGGPAVVGRTVLVQSLRSVALRPCFSTGVPLSCEPLSLHSQKKTVNELRHIENAYC